MNQDPNFPNDFSSPSEAVLRRLLHKEPSGRMGTKGAHEIKESDFFHSVNFQQLFLREAVPPFKPAVFNEEDTRYVPKAYLSAKPEDSVDGSAGTQRLVQHFQDFTFNPGALP